jgi:hypothetical protein
MLEDYKKDIEELKINLTPTTHLEVTAESEHQEAIQVEMMEKEPKRSQNFLTKPCNYG